MTQGSIVNPTTSVVILAAVYRLLTLFCLLDVFQTWMAFIVSKPFDRLVQDVYMRMSGRDQLLQVNELERAMEELFEHINRLAKGKVPRPRVSASKVLQRFDADESGSLDLEEFQEFAKVRVSIIKL